MRRIGLLGTIGLVSWLGAAGLFSITHWNAPEPSPIAMWAYVGLLFGAATATLGEVIRRRDEPHIPGRISYDLGWQQGYRTAEAKYLLLIERQNLLKK